MKKTIFFVLIMASVLVSCNQKNSEESNNVIEKLENDSMAMDSIKVYDNSEMLSCSMHPEVQGKLNDTCSKCGMKLTEPVKK